MVRKKPRPSRVNSYFSCSVFGIRLGTIIFCVLLLIGQVIFALGGFLDKFWLMLVGRFIFGYVPNFLLRNSLI
jgi:hypothetical protein